MDHHRNDLNLDAARQSFADVYGPGGEIAVVRAPGRVNLIGEHTDYNDGFVCPMAIGPHILLLCRRRPDRTLRLASSMFEAPPVEVNLDEVIARGTPSWTNYVRGPAALLKAQGVEPAAMDVLFVNTLPPGGGLSSSAAMEVGTAVALLHLAGSHMDKAAIAKLAQRAEHEFAGVPCGIMDQMVVASGVAGHAMLLDCRSLETRNVPVDPADVRVVVVNSMVKHELTGGEYAERRRQCEEGVKYFHGLDPSVTALRDVSLEQVEAAEDALDPLVFRRCRHVVTETARTQRFADLMATRDYAAAGDLMIESHISMSDDFQITTPELDFLAHAATNLQGCYGSRMTGGGFGGCTVSLVKPEAAEDFVKQLQAAYRDRYDLNPEAFATAATDGAAVVEQGGNE